MATVHLGIGVGTVLHPIPGLLYVMAVNGHEMAFEFFVVTCFIWACLEGGRPPVFSRAEQIENEKPILLVDLSMRDTLMILTPKENIDLGPMSGE